VYPITITARNGVSPTVKQVFLLYVLDSLGLSAPERSRVSQGADELAPG